MYLSYQKYKEWGGMLSDAEFSRFCFRASKMLDAATFNRLKTINATLDTELSEMVQRCCFEVVSYLSEMARNGAAIAIAGVSNDGYSVTYASGDSGKSAETVINDIIYDYLIETDLLYCGTENPKGVN